MAQAAAHLVDHVLPEVPVRQWVLSVPWALRLHLASDPRLCRSVASAYLRAVSASYKRRAQAAGLPPGVRSFSGAINVVQRFGSSLALNVHFHALFLDGIYTTLGPAGIPTFHPAPALDDEEVALILADARRRITRLLHSRGLLPEPGEPPPLPAQAEESLLPFLQAASIQSRVALGPNSGAPLPRQRAPLDHLPKRALRSPLCHTEASFSLHAAVRIDGTDRGALEHLCRYVTRPPLAQGRLQLREDGKVIWQLRRPWRDGTQAFVLDPLTFLERLAALVPHPREHGLTYHGVLAPGSPLRSLIVPREGESEPPSGEDSGPPARSTIGRAPNLSWAELLLRVFGEDVLRCPGCGGRRHMISSITEPETIRRILAHLDLRTEPYAFEPARPPPQAELDWS